MLRAVACASAAALACASPGAAAQGADYQQFLDQWAGGYGHFASTGGEGGKDGKKDAGGAGFDYSQYMPGSQGAQAKTSSATALGSFDYGKYLGGAGGGSSMADGGGYSGYMKKYGDYSKYTGGNGSSGAGGDYSNYSKYTGGSSGGGYGDYSKYSDYSKYTSGASGPSPAPKALSMMAVGGGDFMKKYGSGADWQSLVPKNTSSSAGGASFNFSGYVPFNYSKYQEGQPEQTAVSATDCQDMGCLRAWRAAELSQVDKYSKFAPRAGQDAWSDQIRGQYETNKKRIQERATLISHPVQEPWWLIHAVTPDGPPETEGGAVFSRFSPAQQERFGVDAKGRVQDRARFDRAIAALEAARARNTTAARTMAGAEHSQEERSKAATATTGESRHSREAASAKAVEVRAAAGTVRAAPAEGLSASPVGEGGGVGPARWVVLGSALLVFVGVAVRAGRARPLGSLPEEDPEQAYLALA